MLEGLVRQLILGYLGRYIKDIQKEQLKITLWNEEVLLENVQLIIEAFDYLQLPFALDQGRVGRLSIKIPWKKLGWDPIIITLENVFLRLSQRPDHQWSLDAVETREFAAKKAKLAAAELAKLSRRVCDNQTGQSFISYITAKILDSIQVSIKNFHIQYCDVQHSSGHFLFGLRFSSLIVSRQNPIGSFGGRNKGDQVNKIVEIKALEVYCGTSDGADVSSFDIPDNIHLLQFDASMSLLVNKSGRFENDFAQYSIDAELNNLVISLTEVQLQQILTLSDYLYFLKLSSSFGVIVEAWYGRYRPWGCPLSKKPSGWQKMWWQYAQSCVLSDVRKKLKKASWRYLGQRLGDRRKYVNLYKTKLEFLRQEQSVDEFTLRELEKMEKESDIDDLLSYRSIAELELKEVLSVSSASDIGGSINNNFDEKSQNDERSSGKSRGWLNWLSRGMLGAGGTDDSSQFSGVVSDEVVKDIYEATEFNPLVLSSEDVDANDMIYTSGIKFHISHISASLWSKKSGTEIAKLVLVETVVECKLWEETVTVTALFKSCELLKPCDGRKILRMSGFSSEETVLEEDEQTSCRVQVDVSPNQEVESSVTVTIQSPEVVYDPEFFLNLVEFFSILEAVQFQHQRVLMSLSRIEDVRPRLIAKADYILPSRKKVMWEINIVDVVISVPRINVVPEECILVLQIGSVSFTSKYDLESLILNSEEQFHLLHNFPSSDLSMGFKLQDLFNCFEVKLNDMEMKIKTPCYPEKVSVLEKFCASIVLASCVIYDESILNQLEVFINVNSLNAHLSPTVYEAVVLFISDLDNIHSRSQSVVLENADARNIASNQQVPSIFGLFISAKFESFTFDVDLANDGKNSSILMLVAQKFDVWYSITKSQKCTILLKSLEINTHRKGEKDNLILFSTSSSVHLQDMDAGLNSQNHIYDRKNDEDACFRLDYETHMVGDSANQNYTVFLNDADLHCYPYVFGLISGFIDKISSYNSVLAGANSSSPMSDAASIHSLPSFGFQRFDFSNFIESGHSDFANFSVDNYPYVTIYNSGSLASLESSLRYPISEWRSLCSLRDRKKITSPKCSVNNRSKYFLRPPLKSTLDQVIIYINLCRIEVHFHDSSCIVGTITVASAESSLAISENKTIDMLCSTEGLTLTTSWYSKAPSEFLWGPLFPNLSPILNVRIRRGIGCQLEVSFGIQHVCCVLPPEYLAIIIGYCSLPDWHSNSTEQPMVDNNSECVSYKLEVLDSNLIVPVESDESQFLKVEIPQFYFCFMDECAGSNFFWDIPLALVPEVMVPEVMVPEKSLHLNIFGRDLSLSLLLLKGNVCGPLILDQDISRALIAPLNADVWVRIPCKSESSSFATCIMSRVGTCELFADDSYRFDGFIALIDVINQFCVVDVQSKSFTSNVLEFKKSVKIKSQMSPVVSGTLTELRFCVESFLIKLHHSEDNLVLSNSLASIEMQFNCFVSLIDETPKYLELKFNLLTLYSQLHSVMLAQCEAACSAFGALDICLSKSAKGENEICFSLPSLNIFLHSLAWSEVIDLSIAYALKLTKSFPVDSSEESFTMKKNNRFDHVATPGVSLPTDFELDSMKPGNVFLMKSESIGISINIPIWVTEKSFGATEVSEVLENMPRNYSSYSVNGKPCKFVSVTTQFRNTEVLIVDKTVKLRSVLDKTSGTVGMGEDISVNSWPFFQITQVVFDIEILQNQMGHVHLNMEIDWDRLDVWLSHQLFYFLHDIQLNLSNTGSSPMFFPTVDFKMHLRKISLLISDGRRSCSGPLMEIVTRNILLQATATDDNMDCAFTCDLQVNYNNIQKMLWEPFLEPWKFEIKIVRKIVTTALLNSSVMMDISFTSASHLNLNFPESLFELEFSINLHYIWLAGEQSTKTIQMIKDALGLLKSDDLPENQGFLNSQFTEDICGGRFAPYILQNLTSLPIVYNVCHGVANSDEFKVSETRDGKFVQPGASVPIYLNEASVQQFFRYRATHSSDKLSNKQSNVVSHYFMTIQLDGTSLPCAPISMDLVGLTCFEVDFSKTSNKVEIGDSSNDKENFGDDVSSGFVVPVVFDVSVQRYSKLIRIYSTILDPVYPGQKFPLPLHLAQAGRMRWRPLGNSYLWSEAHNLSNILSHESKIGHLRSFVCYPSLPSSDPFRCCISVEMISLPSSGRPKKTSSVHMKNRVIHLLTLSIPLVVSNFLPDTVSLTVESGGITRTSLLSEVETSFHHVDPSHDLVLELNINGFKPSILKFPRTEAFSSRAKFTGTKFSLSETKIFDPNLSTGPIYVTVEKMMDAFSGAREIFVFVPFLLYNCTSFPLVILDTASETKGSICAIPSCYELDEEEPLQLQGAKAGLGLLSSDQASSSLKNHIVSNTNRFGSNLHGIPSKSVDNRASQLNSRLFSGSQLNLVDNDVGKVKACIYSPNPIPSINEIMVRVSRGPPRSLAETMPDSSWSMPFLLVQPSGSSTVLVPRPSSNSAYIISVTSCLLAGPFAGRTQAITFQPRYIISNACSKDLSYKQKGSDAVFHLGVGQHSHLHWTDITKDLLVSVRFNEPGWQWSGSFLPDHLGDTQVKMRNYVSGGVGMIRVEVQNADFSARDEKIVGSSHGNSGTSLILLSDDDTGYMPYRIDNFSKEFTPTSRFELSGNQKPEDFFGSLWEFLNMNRIRIYQQKCETFDTIVHSYTSSPYAWDEPCFPHRLTVEVPGERVVGLYALDELKDFAPVHLKSTSEKPERKLLLSVHAEGATKVLSIIDASYHIFKDSNDQDANRLQGRKEKDEKDDNFVNYREKFSLTISYIGISLISSQPQELLFVCAKNLKVDLIQSLDLQKLSFQISSMQIDNQLRTTQYPVVLSFNHDYKKEDNAKSKQITINKSNDHVLDLAISKWRKKDESLVSFEYINLRVADFCLELEQQLILSLLDFFKSVSPNSQTEVLQFSDPLIHDMVFTRESASNLRGMNFTSFSEIHRSRTAVPCIAPLGAPWQQIYLLARCQKKIYIESFDLAPIKFTLSFSSAPWMIRNGVLASGESLIHRGIIALADVEGARIYLKQLSIAHHMASWGSVKEILIRHYTRQILHEIYKVFGSAGVIGNPMGFARSVGLGIRDFLSVPARSTLKSPTSLITGMAQGTSSLVTNTVYALSDAATQFSKAAHKGIVAFTFDNNSNDVASQSKGLINEVFEVSAIGSSALEVTFFDQTGLTGLLQSPIKGAEKHGLPGVFSGIALGVTGLVARPAASILEVTGKTAQSIRNRSRLHHSQTYYRVRLPRPLSREFPLRPYSWEEAIGASLILDADNGKFKDEVLVACRALKQAGKFVALTETITVLASCSCLIDYGNPEFRGVAIDVEWMMESVISLDSIIHADCDDDVVHIVGSSSDALLKQSQQQSRKGGGKRWSITSTPLPLFQTSLEFVSNEAAVEFLQILLSTIEEGKGRGWGSRHVLHQSNIR
ncbi:hypothetical protein ACFE04_020992 [Oxalis oulophora]